MPPVIDKDICTGCGQCDLACPIDVLAIDSTLQVAYPAYPDECWHCGSCRQECPVGCLEINFPLRMLICAGGIPY
ncbi:MAG: 4Fe-4S dicluster domain-containing protein [Desulfitobacteriaceae bacterium]